ncbi:MAG: hypothetical protein ACC652_04595 [Acidimicrobiales bacterium]
MSLGSSITKLVKFTIKVAILVGAIAAFREIVMRRNIRHYRDPHSF